MMVQIIGTFAPFYACDRIRCYSEVVNIYSSQNEMINLNFIRCQKPV